MRLDRRKGTHYLDRVRKFHAYARDHDLALSVAQTDVKGDRCKSPLEQEHPDYYLRIVGRDAGGHCRPRRQSAHLGFGELQRNDRAADARHEGGRSGVRRVVRLAARIPRG